MQADTHTGPMIIIGGFASDYPLYKPLQAHLQSISKRPVLIAPLRLADWLKVVLSDSYSGLLRILDGTVREARRRHGEARLTLVAHSAGGVLARIYLGDKPYGLRRDVYHGHRHIGALLTLGTPHSATNSGRFGGLNQVAFVQRTYPGTYWPHIHYVSVIGKSIFGAQYGPPPERGAFQSYKLIAGSGAQWGDGVVPLDNGTLAGSRRIVIAGLRHDPRTDRPWYAESAALVRSWWEQAGV